MIYFDNAATSFPKPKVVLEAMQNYFYNIGGSAGRSAHKLTVKASELIFEAREQLGQLFNIPNTERIVFTKNVTESLNILINGYLKAGDKVVTTSLEHNSVMRPLRYLEKIRKIEVIVIPADKEGGFKLKDFKEVLKKDKVELVIINHASNVIGSLAPLEEIIKITHKYGSHILVDAAQTAGVYPIDVSSSDIDMLAFTGHKSLLGPQGTGGLYVKEGLEIEPLIRGGTGSNSENEWQPDFWPDRLESGTLNIIGITALCAGVKYLLEQRVDKLRKEEMYLTELFIKEVSQIKGIELYGPRDLQKRVAVISFNVAGYRPSEVAYYLDKDFNIACRSGLHCAPSAHKTIGTFPQGTVRFAFGCFTTEDEIEKGIKALYDIARRR